MLKYKQYDRLLKVFLMLVFTILSVIFIVHTLRQIENQKNENILQICKSIGVTLPKDVLSELDANPSDTEKSQYLLIKKNLKDIVSLNKNARFAYLYTQKDGKLYFVASSEPEYSKGYATPGQEYTEAPPEFKQPFHEGNAFVSNEVTDRWGTWITVLVPIVNKSSDRITTVFAMDFNAKSWKSQTIIEVIKSGGIILLIMVVIFISIRIQVQNIKYKNEIIQRKQVEKALIESREQFRLVAEKMTDVVWLMNLKGNIIYVSPSITQFTGHSEEEYMQLALNERLTEESADIAKKVIVDKVISLSDSPEKIAGFKYTEQLEYICKNKETKWGELITTPFFSDNNQLIGIHGVTRDITKRKQAERALKESNLFLKTLMNAIPTPIFYKDTKGYYLGFNSSFEDMIGDRCKDLVGKSDFAIAPHKLAEEYQAKNLDLIKFPGIQVYESQIKDSQGVIQNVIFHKATFTDNNGAVRGIIGVILNITELKRSEAKLNDALALLDASIESTDNGILIVHNDGKTIKVNNRFVEMWSIPKELLTGRNNKEIFKYIYSQVTNPNETEERVNQINSNPNSSSFNILYLNDGRIFKRLIKPMLVEGIPQGKVWTYHDITERKRIEKNLRMSEEKYHQLFDQMMDGFALHEIILNDEGKPIDYLILEVNKSYEQITGLKADDIFSKTVREVLPNIEPIWIEKYGKVALDGTPNHFQQFSADLNKTFEVSVFSPVKGRFATIIKDITERKKAEKEIKMLANAMKSINECVSITDMNDQIIFVNESFLKTYGYTEVEIIGKNASILHSPNTPQKIVERILPSTLSGRWDGELLNVKKDGSEFPIYLSTTTIHDKDANVIALIGVSADISERKKAEELLRKSEERYRTLVVNVGEGIVYVNPNEVFEYANPVAEAIFGAKKGDLMGRSLKEFISEDQFETIRKYTQERKKGQRSSYEIDVTRYDGEKRNILISAVPQFDDNGMLVGAYSVFRDITSRKQDELIIQQQNQELKQLNATKDKFISIIAHDLKSPFNGLLGLTELLVENLRVYDIDKTQEIVESLHSITQQTYKLLENLLDWARNQQNRINFNPIKTDIGSIADETVNLLKPIADAKNISFTLEIKKPCYALADTYMIYAIFRNLISNAIKFTHSGGNIKIEAKTQGSRIQISVNDNGVGMPPESIAKLFRIDTNTSQPGTSGERGTGLGLLLCKDFVEKHEGVIWVESEIEKGSTFFFTLKKYNNLIS